MLPDAGGFPLRSPPAAPVICYDDGRGRNKGMSKLLKLSIDGMHCGGCVTRLTNTLRKLEGVELRHAEVGAAELDYDEQRLTKEDIAAAIEKIGFQVIGSSE
ncbi:MAG: hypothetical protein KatS3mg005_0258 [Bryobacteraceae bacterium]|nr:MAG: hypothetical protein KatS3mg005_0258 [Bryobacteraceae bacterium]